MEDSKKYIPPSAYGSHPTQTNFTPSVESRGALPTVRMFPSDKSSHVPTSVGGTAAALPSGHVSVTGSSSIQVQAQLPSNEVRAHIISSGFPISHQGRDSSPFLHGVERPLNGTYGSQMQGKAFYLLLYNDGRVVFFNLWIFPNDAYEAICFFCIFISLTKV